MDAPNKATVPASVGPCPNCGTQLPAGKRLWLQALLVLLVSAYLPKVVFGLEILAFAILIWRYHYFVCARCDTHVRLARRVGWSTTSVPGGCPSCSQPTEDCTRTERFGTAAMFAAGLFLLSLGALLSLGSFMVKDFRPELHVAQFWYVVGGIGICLFAYGRRGVTAQQCRRCGIRVARSRV